MTNENDEVEDEEHQQETWQRKNDEKEARLMVDVVEVERQAEWSRSCLHCLL